ncbi:MAG: alpha/beta hydrolase [Kiritimatiellae bacterium]|nr:alpha/beta hydrolase [Kiritimatiellia bacterium]
MNWLTAASDFRKVSLLGTVISASALFGLEYRIERNIPYRSPESLAQEGEYAQSRCLLDMRLPVGVTNFATVIHFHGGGIVKGNKGSFSWPEEASEDDPVALISGGYRLLTNATPVQAVSDAAAAVAWTLKNISRYGGDPKKVFVTGISAGGYLTAMVGLDYRWLAKHDLKPTDLAGIIPLTGQMTKHFNVREIGFKDKDPRYTPKVDEWAPLYYASTKPLPPSCFLTGGRDIEMKARVEENELLAASLRACGHTNVEFHETEGNHGGGVYPSRYFLRDFVMKTCNAGGIPRLSDGECTVLTGGRMPDSLVAPYLQMLWSTRYPGSEAKVIAAATPADCCSEKGRLGFKPDRVWTFGEDEKAADRQAWSRSGAKQVLRLTLSPKSMDDVMFNTERYMNAAKDASPKAKDLLTAMLLVDAMHIYPFVARVAIDAKRGIAFAAATSKHRDASGKRLPDCLNVKVPRVDIRKDGIAFTYAPKALPFPVTPEYKEVEKFYPIEKRFNQEILAVEQLRSGTYELAFDGVKVGEFTAEEFGKGVNIAALDTPNQRMAASLVKLAEKLNGMNLDMAEKRKAAVLAAIEDVYEMLNAVRPAVSRVTLKLKAK